MSISPWISTVVVLLVPVLMASRTGRAWLVGGQYSAYVWVALATLSISGVAAALMELHGSKRVGMGVLVATPLLQAITFVVFDKVFQVLVGRAPVRFDEARSGRRADGSQYWSDKAFWLFAWFGLIIGAVFFCGYFDVEFPWRGHR